jgi:hypothetical protein
VIRDKANEGTLGIPKNKASRNGLGNGSDSKRATMFNPPDRTPPFSLAKDNTNCIVMDEEQSPAVMPPVPPAGLEPGSSPDDTWRALVSSPGGVGNTRSEQARWTRI